MSVEIHQFLDNSGGNNFTENTPRPPVGPGEENERHSTGGNSNKSSGSLKSQQSNKSCNSAGAATPRRSQKVTKAPLPLSSSMGGNTVAADEADAPLGFEPEGSVDQNSLFTENTLPAYANWTENLDNLLEDSDGVTLFQKYLVQEGSVNLFEFYFAWKYLQELDPEETKDVPHLVKTMYKVFIKGDREKKLALVSQETKDNIAKSVSAKRYSIKVFDGVKDEVVELLKKQFYPSFFKSDIYLQYVQAMEDSPKDSVQSSGSGSVRPLSSVLPTVHEDSELNFHPMTVRAVNESRTIPSDSPVTLSLTANNMRMTERLRLESKIKPEEQAGYYLQKREDILAQVSHPYHTCSTSYMPISALDSEQQSLSSDAQTDDTLSITDSNSNVDGFPQYSNKKSIRRYYKRQKSLAQQNPDPHLSNHFLPPKNHRMAKVSNLAETDPKEFARVLSEKLQQVLDELNRREMVRSKLHAMSEDDGTDDSHSILSSTTGGATHSSNTLDQLLVAIQAGEHDEEKAQNILDRHCKRIWEKSGQHTPAKSPSRAKSPDYPIQQSKRIHTTSRQSQPMTSRPIPYQKMPQRVSSSNKQSAFSALDASYPQSGLSSYNRPSSRHGMATFSSRLEQQSVFKPPPVQTNSNQKVVDWISRSMQEPNPHSTESEKSSTHKRSSQRSGSTSASPRSHRTKSHSKGKIDFNKHAVEALVSEAKRFSVDDKHSSKSKSTTSSGKDRSALSRSAGESAMLQTLTQRKGVPVPPQLKVAFFLPEEPIPYSVTVQSHEITLVKFKELVTKKGNYRYFFKKKPADDEFGVEVPYVLQEFTRDSDVLPTWADKVICYVKKA